MGEMNSELAKKIIEAAKKHAEKLKIPMSIAVVDEGGNLVAFERMDGAGVATIQIAQDKAWTSAGTGYPTDQLQKIAEPGNFAYGAANAASGRLTIFGGGVPLKRKGKLVGGIGASGGRAVPDDKEVADAGAKVLE